MREMSKKRFENQIEIEDRAHFYTEKKKFVEHYCREKRKQGYSVELHPAGSMGWVVISRLYLVMGGR